MGSRSHLVGKGAMREHLAYQSSVRRSAAAGAEARAASGMPKPCKACAGRHVAHVCGKAKAKSNAGKKTKAAKAARLNTAGAAQAAGRGPFPLENERMHIIGAETQLLEYFSGEGREKARRAQEEAARLERERAAADAVAADAAAADEQLTVTGKVGAAVMSPIRSAARHESPHSGRHARPTATDV